MNPALDFSSAHRNLDKNGHTLLQNVLSENECARWGSELSAILRGEQGDAITGNSKRIVGGRNLQATWNGWLEKIQTESLTTFLRRELGDSFGLVRILYFDKPPGQSWNLALHRDRTIAVARHLNPAEPYGKPTTKAGVRHVEADQELLTRMLTLRFHLDKMHHDNGPLIVVPGSHVECDSNTSPSSTPSSTIEIHCNAGDVFVMKPLLLHGSRSSETSCPDHRRVVHLEFAPRDALAALYQWHQYDSIPHEG